MWSAAACRRLSSFGGLAMQYKFPGRRKSVSPSTALRVNKLPDSKRARQFFSAARGSSLGYVKVNGSVRRVILRVVHRLHHQAVGTWLEVVHFHLHPDGNHGISLLDEFI